MLCEQLGPGDQHDAEADNNRSPVVMPNAWYDRVSGGGLANGAPFPRPALVSPLC